MYIDKYKSIPAQIVLRTEYKAKENVKSHNFSSPQAEVPDRWVSENITTCVRLNDRRMSHIPDKILIRRKRNTNKILIRGKRKNFIKYLFLHKKWKYLKSNFFPYLLLDFQQNRNLPTYCTISFQTFFLHNVIKFFWNSIYPYKYQNYISTFPCFGESRRSLYWF